MTEHVPEGFAGKAGVVVLSAGVGLVQWLSDPQVLKAAVVAAACGLIGGAFKPLGSYLSRRAARWWTNRRKG